MFHQVNVEVLGLVENMSQMTLPDGTIIDVFGAGATQQTAKQYNLPFLGSIDLDPQVREGGDRGLPSALAGDTSNRGKEFLAIALKVAVAAAEVASHTEDVLEIT
jgi:ATP-binding protein involved in chromosome partitioning